MALYAAPSTLRHGRAHGVQKFARIHKPGQPHRVALELYPRQHDFVTFDDQRFSAFIGGIGSGKTTAGAVKGLVHSQDKAQLGLIIAPTYTMLRDATIRSVQEIFGPVIRKYHKGDMILELRNGSEILCRSGDNPDRLRGPNIDWAWIDEGALCPGGTFEITMGRLRKDGKAGPLWLTSTPKGYNWVWQKRELMRMFKARTRDNPYNDPEFFASLEQAYSGQFAQQELDGEFVSFEGLIYNEFSYDTHVFSMEQLGLEDSDFQEVIIGADEGYVNPSVFLVMGIWGGGERVHIREEYYERKVLQADVALAGAELAGRYTFSGRPTVQFYLDPSAPGLRAELQSHNLAVAPANHAVWDGIQAVKYLLNMWYEGSGKLGIRMVVPALTIDPSCVWTISEMQSYIWKEVGARGADGQRGQIDEPLKQNDHAMDSGRYGIFSHLGGLGGQLAF